MVSADDQDTVTGARGMEVTMDEKLSEIDDQCDLVVLPGGIPGVPNLKTNSKVQAMVKAQNDRGGYVAAHLACLRTRMQHVIRDVRISSWRSATARSR